MKSMFKNLLFLSASVAVFSGCSPQTVTVSQSALPDVIVEGATAEEGSHVTAISVFRFNNFTDTPRAGMRAANLFSGLLAAEGYNITNHIDTKSYTFEEARDIAKEDGSEYFVYGGVSEWRYKTGIDGEPAVSVQVNLYDTKTGVQVWNATASDSDWGNGSIGTTAQELFQAILNSSN